MFLLISGSYYKPKLTEEEIRDASESLNCRILEHLNSKSVLPTVIAFKHAHFNFLFENKGKKNKDRGYILLEKNDIVTFRIDGY